MRKCFYPALRQFTPEEYLRIERAAETRSEYLDGSIYAMAGGNQDHDLIKENTSHTLRMLVRGKGCRVYSSDMRVFVGERAYFYPDVSVACGSEKEGKSDIVRVATLVCEVSSKSTARYDQRVKLKEYRLMPSMREILFISQERVDIQHHFRHDGHLWDVRQYSSLHDSIPLESIGIELPIAAIYEEMGFE